MEWIKRENAGELVMLVLIWGVFSLLGTRLYLEITGYPQVGHGEWHIAHVLFGGVLMIWGMLLSLMFHGEKIRKLGASVFGFGMGWFIDEVGKFLSADNNYFFQPAVMLIYIFFVVLFLVYRYVEWRQPKDEKTLLYQVINRLEEVAEGDLEATEKTQILAKLESITQNTQGSVKEFAFELSRLIAKIEAKTDKEEDWVKKMWRYVKRFGYHQLFKRRIILIILEVLAIIYGLGGIVDAVSFAILSRKREVEKFIFEGKVIFSASDLRMVTYKTIADLASSVMFLVGIFWVYKKHPRRGLHFFQYGLLINIFLSSVFRFYFEQVSGVFGVFLSIVILMGLKRLARDLPERR